MFVVKGCGGSAGSALLSTSVCQACRFTRSTSRLERLLQPNSVVSLGVDRPGGLTFGLVDAVSVRDGREGRGS